MVISMIILTKLGGKEILVNERLIESAKETPDTVVTMSGGTTYIVSETLDEIMDKVLEYNRLSKRDIRSRKPRFGNEPE